MKNRFHQFVLVSFTLTILLLPALPAPASAFEALAIPSLMHSDMDGWYKIPPNSGPNIHKTSRVFQGQLFSLLVLFKNSTADEKGRLHVRYDVQVFDPHGNPTEDRGSDLVAYQGEGGQTQGFILSQQYLKIVFTDVYPFGTYRITVSVHDKIGGESVNLEVPVRLAPFSLPDPFQSQEAAADWMMGYYQNPTPEKAVRAVQEMIQLDSKWLEENLHMLVFFRNIFSDHPFVLENIAKLFSSFSKEERKKLLFLSVISVDSRSNPLLSVAAEPEHQAVIRSAQKIEFPDTSGDIDSPAQLDILWSEFFSTGRYEPIKKIVSALELNQYKGTISGIRSGKIKLTPETQKRVYLEAAHGSAVWSLASNCKQSPLVFKYCVYMYENEDLEKDVRDQLGAILQKVQQEIRKDQIPDEGLH